MKGKFGRKELIAILVGTVLFAVLTKARIPLRFIPNTELHIRMAVLAFFSAVYGPIVGAVVGVCGHAFGDAIFGGTKIWWSWVLSEAIVGAVIGFFADKFAVRSGGFTKSKNIVLFILVEIIANALAWIFVAPALDMLLFKESFDTVFVQGMFAFFGNILVIGILGTLPLILYSDHSVKSKSKEDDDYLN
ncbi:ECF-type riboflavin transporter substrate-binding protein [Butyrivibrio sp. X503]|uniref:ECF-type riboflavin transporter substrate-binding protein n=1 Tax=Butyrivibrio sp. X503 TaxID=2364878 RepID=UPI000EA88F39|nr:ECF-type riboflavin transporter substrate-binding protein [Butyrivibrio sp. X503]RKM56409.1 ECF-type riboflavin transporter substrate-binding protein [Butyrivibrio sp. X503]